MGETELPNHYRRNFWSLVLDYCFFGIGMAFISQNTVFPSFLTVLGASSSFIGLVSSLQSAGWLLPQLFAARYLADKPYKKRYILWPAALSRTLILVMAITVWVTGAQPSWLVMVITPLVVSGFWVGDGLASVAWFDLLSKVIPPQRRGRLIGTGQVLSGILSFIAGFVVEWMLSKQGPSFPHNYAYLFLLGFAMLTVSTFALSMLLEQKGVSAAKAPSWREYFPQLWDVLKHDRTFRRYIIARQLSGLAGLSIPFYMPYALEKLSLPPQVAGRYTSIGVIGGIFAALVFGWINERYGSKRVIQLGIALSTTIPAIALLIPRVITDPTWLAWGYGLVFLALSALMSSMMAGWMTFVLEWAPEAKRPTYVGLTNTLNGLTTLFSTLGGLILQWTGNNYDVLFAITIVGLLLAWPLPFLLPEPRHKTVIAEQVQA
jgi:MFS family permease